MKKINASIKLLGIAGKADGKRYAIVAPFVVYKDNPLYNVKDVFNAILVKGDMLGDVMFYGKGAGSLPTASAVVSDVVDAVKRHGYTAKIHWSTEKRDIVDAGSIATQNFVRVSGDKAAILKIAVLVLISYRNGDAIVTLDEFLRYLIFLSKHLDEALGLGDIVILRYIEYI